MMTLQQNLLCYILYCNNIRKIPFGTAITRIANVTDKVKNLCRLDYFLHYFFSLTFIHLKVVFIILARNVIK